MSPAVVVNPNDEDDASADDGSVDGIADDTLLRFVDTDPKLLELRED